MGGGALLRGPRRAGLPGWAPTDTFVAYEPTLERAILPQTDGIANAARAPARLLTAAPLVPGTRVLWALPHHPLGERSGNAPTKR